MNVNGCCILVPDFVTSTEKPRRVPDFGRFRVGRSCLSVQAERGQRQEHEKHQVFHKSLILNVEC